MNQAVQEKGRAGWTAELCARVADSRRALYLIVIGLVIFCCFSGEWASIRERASAYAPPDTESGRAWAALEAEFDDLGAARILLDNVSASQARTLSERLSLLAGVQSVSFDELEDYRTGRALLSVTFRTPDGAPETRRAMASVRSALDGYDFSIDGDADGNAPYLLNGEPRLIIAALCAFVCVALSLLARVPALTGFSILALTFGTAFLLDSGTWFLFGEISPVAAVSAGLVQLAFCTAGVIPLFRRCVEARTRMDTREAVLTAWGRTAPAIYSGAAVTLCLSLALGLLRARVGADPGLVVCKAAALALVTLCVLTPGLLVSLCGALDRTRERERASMGAFAVGTRVLMPMVLLALLVASAVCMGYFPRAYSADDLPIWFRWGNRAAEGEIEALFGTRNELSLLVPAGDPDRESALLEELSGLDEVRSARGLANIEATDGRMMAERLTPRHFAELMDIDIDEAQELYSAYIQKTGAYEHLAAGLDKTALPIAEALIFTCDRAREGYVTLDWGRENQLELLYRRAETAVRQMRGEHYSRIMVRLALPEEGAKMTAFLYTLRNTAERYYPQGVLLAGDAPEAADLSNAFARDGILFAALTFAVALVALVFGTGSAGVAVALSLAVLCGVWLNFSIWLALGQNLYFLTELVSGAALMGIGVLFAVLLGRRFLDLQPDTRPEEAAVQSLREASRTLTLSGVTLAVAGIVTGALCGNRAASLTAVCIGAGTVILSLIALFAIPQTLLLLANPSAGAAKASRPDKAVKPEAEETSTPKAVKQAKAAREKRKPVKAETDAAREKRKPVKTETDAAREKRKPVKTETDAAREKRKPVKTETGAAESKPVTLEKLESDETETVEVLETPLPEASAETETEVLEVLEAPDTETLSTDSGAKSETLSTDSGAEKSLSDSDTETPSTDSAEASTDGKVETPSTDSVAETDTRTDEHSDAPSEDRTEKQSEGRKEEATGHEAE